MIEFRMPTHEEKIESDLKVIEHHMRFIFMAKRIAIEDGVSEQDIDAFIADVGAEMQEKFMKMPYEEFRDEIRKDIRERLAFLNPGLNDD